MYEVLAFTNLDITGWDFKTAVLLSCYSEYIQYFCLAVDDNFHKLFPYFSHSSQYST